MPLLRVVSNHPVPEADQPKLLMTLSEAVADMLGKPEQYVMVTYEHNPAMLFAGKALPLAYLELKSIGLPEERTAELSAALTKAVTAQLPVKADRVYIEFSNAHRHLWGWNGATF